jgi:hypothetical protein
MRASFGRSLLLHRTRDSWNEEHDLMKSTSWLINLSVFVLISVALIPIGRPAVAAQNEAMLTVRTLLAKIKAETESLPRHRLFEELWHFIRDMKPSDRDAFDPDVVDQIASLLHDKDEGVRTDAAVVLGAIGAPALRSVGALLRALCEIRADRRRGPESGIHDVDGIYAALINLKVVSSPKMDSKIAFVTT